MTGGRPQPRTVLVLGVGPLPEDKASRLHAPGLRTSHIADLLARHRYHVVIGLIDFGDFRGNDDAARSMPKREDIGEHITVCRLRYHPRHTPNALHTLHRIYHFTCVVSTTDIMNSIAAKLPMRLPLWLDYNGDPFAEKQLQALVHANDASLLDQWKLYLDGLLAGDRFSTCSSPQTNALIGHLGFAGRLNEYTSGEPLVHTLVPCSTAVASRVSRTGMLIKSLRIPAESYMVLWSGGYNTWCDTETLFQGMELAMAEQPNLFFVSTGGEIGGHDSETFKRFKRKVETSPFAKRYYFAGWVGNDDMRSFYEQADVAVNADIFSYEGELGYRNRIAEWMQFKLPVITTCLCELTKELRERDLVTPFEIGNARSLADGILAVVRNLPQARARAARAEEYFREEMDDEKIYKPLIQWVLDPVYARDRQAWFDQTNEAVPRQAGLAAIHLEMLGLMPGAKDQRKGQSLFRRVLRKIAGRK